MIQSLSEWLFRTPQNCQRCQSPVYFHITSKNRHGNVTELHLCDTCTRQELASFPPEGTPNGSGREVCVEVETILTTRHSNCQGLTLRECDGERRHSLWIGLVEALTIDSLLKGVRTTRPHTHATWLATIDALDAKIESVHLHDYREQTHFAEVYLIHRLDRIRVDSRPTDAIVLALHAAAPIYLADRVFSAGYEDPKHSV